MILDVLKIYLTIMFGTVGLFCLTVGIPFVIHYFVQWNFPFTVVFFNGLVSIPLMASCAIYGVRQGLK